MMMHHKLETNNGNLDYWCVTYMSVTWYLYLEKVARFKNENCEGVDMEFIHRGSIKKIFKWI